MAQEVERKQCRKCLMVKPAVDFYRNWRNADTLHSYCKACQKVINTAQADIAKERRFASTRQVAMPTVVAFDVLDRAQDGLCARCGAGMEDLCDIILLVPESMGGGKIYSNMVLVCLDCKATLPDVIIRPVTSIATLEDAMPKINVTAIAPTQETTRECKRCGESKPASGWSGIDIAPWCRDCDWAINIDKEDP